MLVVSGDAVGPNHAGWHLLPEVLAKLGAFASAGCARAATGRRQPPPGFDPVKAVRDMMPKEFRKSLARLLPTEMRDKLAQAGRHRGGRLVADQGVLPADRSRRLIRVNLKGREPMGTVAARRRVRAAADELTAALRILRNPANGQPVVSDVLRADAAFPGCAARSSARPGRAVE